MSWKVIGAPGASVQELGVVTRKPAARATSEIAPAKATEGFEAAKATEAFEAAGPEPAAATAAFDTAATVEQASAAIAALDTAATAESAPELPAVAVAVPSPGFFAAAIAKSALAGRRPEPGLPAPV